MEVNKDIKIKFSGLRPGEKLYEELLSDSENTLPTYHPKIMIAKVLPENFADISIALKEIEILLKNPETSRYQIVHQLKELIPEYVSNNSEFELLDASVAN